MRKPGDVAAWPRQVVDQSAADRVAHLSKHDRYRARCLFRQHGRAIALDDDDIGRQRDQFGSIRCHRSEITARKAEIETDVVVFSPAKLLEAALQYLDA